MNKKILFLVIIAFLLFSIGVFAAKNWDADLPIHDGIKVLQQEPITPVIVYLNKNKSCTLYFPPIEKILYDKGNTDFEINKGLLNFMTLNKVIIKPIKANVSMYLFIETSKTENAKQLIYLIHIIEDSDQQVDDYYSISPKFGQL